MFALLSDFSLPCPTLSNGCGHWLLSGICPFPGLTASTKRAIDFGVPVVTAVMVLVTLAMRHVIRNLITLLLRAWHGTRTMSSRVLPVGPGTHLPETLGQCGVWTASLMMYWLHVLLQRPDHVHIRRFLSAFQLPLSLARTGHCV